MKVSMAGFMGLGCLHVMQWDVLTKQDTPDPMYACEEIH